MWWFSFFDFHFSFLIYLKLYKIKNSSATFPSVPRDPLNCLTMILESRDTISYALAAYSDFRATQSRKSSLCTTQFYKNIHISARSITSSQFVLTPSPPSARLSPPPKSAFSRPFEGGIFLQQKKNNFQTKLASHQVQVTATTFKVGKTPPRKYCTRTRIGKGKSELLRPHQYTLTLLMTPLCA